MLAHAPRRAAHTPGGPFLKSTDEISAITDAASIVERVLRALARAATPGTTTADLDALARRIMHEVGATPAFLGQRDLPDAPGFPGAVCACLNDQVVHALPGPATLRPGDLLTIDAGVNHRGWFADAAVTLVVPDSASGEPNPEAHRVAAGARSVLQAALTRIAPGVRWSTIARAMEAHAAELGLGIVTEFVGHGIGRSLHELPKAPAWWDDQEFEDFELQPGLVLAIEPIVTTVPGRTRTVLDPDGWTVRTGDGCLAAHAEAMVALDPITARPRILAGGWGVP